MDVVLGVAGVVAAIGTTVLGFMAHRFTKDSASQAAQRAIGDLANSMASLRIEHPEVLRYARHWTAGDWDVVYGARVLGDADTPTRYYCYVDVGLEFCNTALAAMNAGAVTKKSFDSHYGRLVRLFLTENYPMIEQVRQGPYVSVYVRDALFEAERDGWDWRARHDALVEEPQ